MCRILLSLLIVSLLTSSALAATIKTQDHPSTKRLVATSEEVSRQGKDIGAGIGVARTDTLYLLGGPLGNGDFQDVDGEPAWEGWIGIDNTSQAESHWHMDTFNCADLDPSQPVNHAWWCGALFEPCHAEDSAEGYGNNWLDYLDWRGSVPDPASGVTVRITARLNYDVEPGYDYVYLECEGATGAFTTIATFNGDNRNDSGDFIPEDVNQSFTIDAGDYTGPAQDQVHLRWRFVSDMGWSDQDCAWPTDGAAQIDLIAVYFDQGTGDIQMGETETCEPGEPAQWEVSFSPGCGMFAKVWPYLYDLDACRSNATPMVAFIDDGEVVSGTGGYLCTTWCYGPGGYIVNPVGGLRGPEFGVDNEIWSPVLAWPGSEYTRATMEYDQYVHETFGPGFPGILTSWAVVSTADPNGEGGWERWNSGIWFYGGPSFGRRSFDVSSAIVPDCQYVRVCLLMLDVPGIPGTDGPPAPYFDNVVLKAYTYDGPFLRVYWSGDLTQDNFPEIGTIDYDNLGANHVRFDAAEFELDSEFNPIAPRDQIMIEAAPIRTGSVLNDFPEMHYKLRPNPLFDPYRTSGIPNEGFVHGDSARSSQGEVIENFWAFDLPDTGFFFPGDVIHYYFTAQDNAGGDIGTAIIPADTSGYSLFPGDEDYVNGLYPEMYITRALPSLREATEGITQPEILFWNDGYGTAAWNSSLDNLGYLVGYDYDLYWSNGAGTNNRNGLGTRATATQLIGYNTLLYSSWVLSAYTMVDAGGGEVTLNCLSSWLMSGNRNMLLTGDGLVEDLVSNGSGSGLSFVSNWISVNYIQHDVRPLIGNQTAPLVQAIPGNPVFFALDEWIAHGGCPGMNEFNAVEVIGNAQRIAQFTNPDGQGWVYPYAAAAYHHNTEFSAKTVYLPYDLQFVMTPHGGAAGKEAGQLAARTRLLEEVLFAFGHMGQSPTVDVPEPDRFSVQCYPNPFNPRVKIAYHMPRRGELAVKIYNLRGEVVRTLIDEQVAAGDGFVPWDGTDGSGRAVASGVYFVETHALGDVYVDKLALVK